MRVYLKLSNNKLFKTHAFKFTESNFQFHETNLPANKSFFSKFVRKIKAMINKRILAFRLVFYSSFVLLVFSFMRYSNNINFAKNITPEYFLSNECSENNFYNVAGIVKPGSIQIIKGTDEMSFILTDYEHEISIYYKGQVPNNFLEGNTVIATGSITNSKKPDILMCTKVQTDHGYNSDQWLSK